ncbi:MAG TPA: hypothetical protein VJB66_04790 [Candidatus Nanoarchaeia archaeon]|nr:hypothetical protein [Candidatus Nanoarchaeia archaeon]
MREKSLQEVYDEFCASGEYVTKEVDINSIRKMMSITQEDLEYLEFLLKQKTINWRIIYTLHYDILRSLCEALIQSDGMKVSNHQETFAYVCIKHPQLEFDWNFFEKIRTARNRNKYEGKDIFKNDWKEIDIQMKLYIDTLIKSVKEVI